MRSSSLRDSTNARSASAGKRKLKYFLCLFLLGATAFFFMHLGSSALDFIGEYSCQHPDLGNVHLSLYRTGEGIGSDLSFGHGTYLRAVPSPDQSAEKLNITFQVPKERIDKRHRARTIIFQGTIHDDSVKGLSVGTAPDKVCEGVLIEGTAQCPVKLTRDLVGTMEKKARLSQEENAPYVEKSQPVEAPKGPMGWASFWFH